MLRSPAASCRTVPRAALSSPQVELAPGPQKTSRIAGAAFQGLKRLGVFPEREEAGGERHDIVTVFRWPSAPRRDRLVVGAFADRLPRVEILPPTFPEVDGARASQAILDLVAGAAAAQESSSGGSRAGQPEMAAVLDPMLGNERRPRF